MALAKKVALGVAFLSLLIVGLFRIGNCPPIPPLGCSLLGVGCPSKELWVGGEVKEGWEGVVERLKENWRKGYELGGSLSVFFKGERVIDLVFGWEDREFEERYRNETLQIVFSSTKVVESVVIAMLVDRGLLSYEEKVTKYWPEFAQNGKEDVTIGDLMSHAGGVAGGLPQKLSPQDFKNDREGNPSPISSSLAATPLDENCFRQKGTQGYHAVSRGLFASQLVRRVDPLGRSLDAFARDEIVRPMGLDFRIGLVEEGEVERNGEVQETPIWRKLFGALPRFLLPKWMTDPFFNDIFLDEDEMRMMTSLGNKSGTGGKAIYGVFNGDFDLNSWGRDPGWRQIESPSTHGYTNGQTLGRIAQMMENKGTDPWTGTKIMSEKTWKKATTLFPVLYDSVISSNVQYTQGGFGDVFKSYPGECVGWGGAGGSLIQWCPEADLSIGYAMNYYSPHGMDWRGQMYLKEAFEIAKKKM